jgi:hypothetical protein
MRWSIGDILMFIFMSIMTVIVVLYVLFNIGLYMGVMNAEWIYGADAVHGVSARTVQVIDQDIDSCAWQDHFDQAQRN